MKISIISFTKVGGELNHRLTEILIQQGYKVFSYDRNKDNTVQMFRVVEEAFANQYAMIFISATGIAVRGIAPYIKDKFTDPAVLCMDEKGKYVISLLSGHLGGANGLTEEVANLLGATAIISTATDLNHIWAVDTWAKKNHLFISDRELAKKVSATLLHGGTIELVSGYKIYGEVPRYLRDAKAKLGVYITNRNFKKSNEEREILRLIPRSIALGVGCKKDIDPEYMLQSFEKWARKYYIEKKAIYCIATVDIKKEEKAIIRLAEYLGVEIISFTPEELKKVKGEFQDSEFVQGRIGVGNVCERACRCIYSEPMIPKESYGGITFASSYNKNLSFTFDI